jgi:hypothetical protein
MSTEAFEKFRDIVLNDPDLQADLAAISDIATFTARVLERGAERGLAIDAADITRAMNDGQRALIEQWI